MSKRITLSIPGTPRPKGSLKCIGARGRKGGHQLIEDHRPGQKEWRTRIADTVRTRVTARAEPGQPVAVTILFVLPRPTSHYGTGKNAGLLKATAAQRVPTGHRTGDLDKLARLVLDALEDGELYPDDSAVTILHTRKTYVGAIDDPLGFAGARITITI